MNAFTLHIHMYNELNFMAGTKRKREDAVLEYLRESDALAEQGRQQILEQIRSSQASFERMFTRFLEKM